MSDRRRALFLGGLAMLLMMPLRLEAAETVNEPRRLTFRQALEMAQRRHLGVLVANERVAQALARLAQARSTILPQVSGSASETRQTKNLEAAGITLPGRQPVVGPFNTFDARLRLTQTLFDLTALERFRAARVGRQLSLAEYQKARADAMALVATLYVEAQRAADGLEVAHAVLLRDARRLQIANRQADLGVGSALELKEAEAQYVQRLYQWQAAIAHATEQRLDLTAALGLPAGHAIIFLEEETPADAFRPTHTEALARVATHPDVSVVGEEVHERRAERAAAIADFLPKASISADYGASGRSPSASDATYSIGGQVTLPILEGGLRAARIREATSQLRESQARLANTQGQVEANVLSALESVQQALVFVKAQEIAFVASTKELALAQQRLKTGIGTKLELVEATAQATLARDQQDESLATLRIAQVNLAHAMGNMDSLMGRLP